jgi:hypothetical protein
MQFDTSTVIWHQNFMYKNYRLHTQSGCGITLWATFLAFPQVWLPILSSFNGATASLA